MPLCYAQASNKLGPTQLITQAAAVVADAVTATNAAAAVADQMDDHTLAADDSHGC